MTIQPYGEINFTKRFIYLGVYCRKGLSAGLAYGFGPIGERKVQACFDKNPIGECVENEASAMFGTGSIFLKFDWWPRETPRIIVYQSSLQPQCGSSVELVSGASPYNLKRKWNMGPMQRGMSGWMCPVFMCNIVNRIQDERSSSTNLKSVM